MNTYTLNKKELKDGLVLGGKVVPNNPTMPILTQVRISADKVSVTLYSTNLETYIKNTLSGRGSEEEVRPTLNSVAIYPNGGMVATDGFRFVVVGEIPEENKGYALMPAHTAKIIAGIKQSTGALSYLKGVGNMVDLLWCYIGNIEIRTIPVDGNFPDALAIIPKQVTDPTLEFKFELKFKTQDLIPILKSFIPVAKIDKRLSRSMWIEMGENGLVELSVTNDSTSIAHTLRAAWRGDPFRFAVNPKFVLQVVELCQDEYITILLNAPNTPMVIQWDNFISVIMPMHLG